MYDVVRHLGLTMEVLELTLHNIQVHKWKTSAVIWDAKFRVTSGKSFTDPFCLYRLFRDSIGLMGCPSILMLHLNDSFLSARVPCHFVLWLNHQTLNIELNKRPCSTPHVTKKRRRPLFGSFLHSDLQKLGFSTCKSWMVQSLDIRWAIATSQIDAGTGGWMKLDVIRNDQTNSIRFIKWKKERWTLIPFWSLKKFTNHGFFTDSLADATSFQGRYCHILPKVGKIYQKNICAVGAKLAIDTWNFAVGNWLLQPDVFSNQIHVFVVHPKGAPVKTGFSLAQFCSDFVPLSHEQTWDYRHQNVQGPP